MNKHKTIFVMMLVRMTIIMITTTLMVAMTLIMVTMILTYEHPELQNV